MCIHLVHIKSEQLYLCNCGSTYHPEKLKNTTLDNTFSGYRIQCSRYMPKRPHMAISLDLCLYQATESGLTWAQKNSNSNHGQVLLALSSCIVTNNRTHNQLRKTAMLSYLKYMFSQRVDCMTLETKQQFECITQNLHSIMQKLCNLGYVAKLS